MSIDLNDRLNKTWLHPLGEAVVHVDHESDTEIDEEEKEENFFHQNHDHFCDEHEIDIEIIKNDFTEDTHQLIDTQQGRLENAVQNIEGEVVGNILSKVQRTKNAFEEESDIISNRDRAMFANQLTTIIAAYYVTLFPVFANQLIKTRAKEFGQESIFNMTKSIERYIQVTARRASESHINTIISDIQKTASKAYEEEVARHIREAKENGIADQEAFEYARKRALEGASQQKIISDITTKYQDISKNRAKTIARTETNRAFTQSQFQADLQFLRDTGLMDNAYKQWVTRSENPCPYCMELASRGPIPFNENFESLGAELHYDYTKKNGEIVKRTLKIDYEDLEAGNAHVNCQCKYKLIIKDANGNFVENGFRFAKVLNKGYNPYRDKDGKFGSGPSVKVSDLERDSIKLYNSSAYLMMNKLSRGENGLSLDSSGYKEDVNNIDNVISRNKLKKDVTLYRGIQRSTGDSLNLSPGKVITDKALMSTSLNKAIASKFGGGVGYIVSIKAKKGTSALDMNNVDGYDNVKYKDLEEFLLPRNTKLKINSIDTSGSEVIVNAEVVK